MKEKIITLLNSWYNNSNITERVVEELIVLIDEENELVGKRVTFSRNGYDGNGIVTGLEEGVGGLTPDKYIIAVNVPLSSPQTYATFKEDELTVKDF